jgi:hypothetical protein
MLEKISNNCSSNPKKKTNESLLNSFNKYRFYFLFRSLNVRVLGLKNYRRLVYFHLILVFLIEVFYLDRFNYKKKKEKKEKLSFD